MKNKIISLLLVAVTLLSGCGLRGDDGAVTGSMPEKGGTDGAKMEKGAEGNDNVYTKPEMKGEITVSAWYDEGYLSTAAKEFMVQYPEVTVTIHQFYDGSAEPSHESYRNWLNTKIMSGKADDIICTTSLPVRKYSDMGVFEDLSGFVSAAGELNDENFYMKALEACRDAEGRMYLVPYACSFETVNFDRRLVAEKMSDGWTVPMDGSRKSMSFRSAMSIARELVDATAKENAFMTMESCDSYMNRLLKDEIRKFIDMDTKKININTKEYIDLLNEVKELSSNRKYFAEDGSIDFYNDEYYFACRIDMDWQSAYYNLLPEGSDSHGVPLADADGNVFMSSGTCFGINSASPHKELAWEFIRFLLSDEMQSSPALYSMPVNRKGCEAYVRRNLQLYNEGNNANVDEKEAQRLLEQWMEQINKCDMFDPVISDYLWEENKNFFQGKQSAEDTAQILQTKVEQYFNE